VKATALTAPLPRGGETETLSLPLSPRERGRGEGNWIQSHRRRVPAFLLHFFRR
jgi:hypothetical protein